ncbi:MAG: hypothetical protein ACJ8CR_20405 [Roseiflexaceae bacterium]
MPTPEDIEAQHKLLEAHRRTLALYLVQQAKQGGATYVLPGVANGILETRDQIQRCKQTLREWNVVIENHADDSPPAAAGDVPLPQASPSERAGAGLYALADLLRVAEARAAAAAYQANFQIACRQIEALSLYKQLHDLFQQLDDRYTLIVRFSKGLPANQAAWEDIERDEPDLYVTADMLLGMAGKVPLAGEATLWAQKLGRAQRELRSALEAYDAEGLKDELGRLKDLIDRQLSRTNTRLVGAAEALDLATLVKALRTICDQLDLLKLEASALRRLDDFRSGVEALAELNRRLTTLVELHAAFQDIDDELRLIEGLLEQDPGSLADTWQDLRPLMRAICENNPADWATKLTKLSTDLETALQSPELIQIRRCFGRYRSQAVQSFNQIDHDLLTLCAELQQVGAPLGRVLGVIE